MSYESHKYYNGNLYASTIKDVKNQQLFMDLNVGIIMDVKKSTIKPICKYYNGCKKNQQLFTRPICGYYNGCKKTSNYLRDLYAGIATNVKKPVTIYETYMRVLQWM